MLYIAGWLMYIKPIPASNRSKTMARVQREASQAAAMIRKHLKANGVIASVLSGGNKVTITVSNPLPGVRDQIEGYASQFQMGSFNGMEDIYEYNNRNDLPQVRFVFVEADYDDELIGEARKHVAERFNPDHLSEHERDYLLPRQILTGSIESDFWTSRKPRVRAA